jgi:hypothetical protein
MRQTFYLLIGFSQTRTTQRGGNGGHRQRPISSMVTPS